VKAHNVAKVSIGLVAILSSGCYHKLIAEAVGRNLAGMFANFSLSQTKPKAQTTNYLLSESMRVVISVEKRALLRSTLGRYSTDTKRESYIFCYKEDNPEHSRDAIEFVRLAKHYSRTQFVCEQESDFFLHRPNHNAFVEIIRSPPMRGSRSDAADPRPDFASTKILVQDLEKYLTKLQDN